MSSPAVKKTAPKKTLLSTKKKVEAIFEEPVEREPRGARRKRDTRARLLTAALHLMAARGVDGVAINEITEAADVGFGSFYNHFPSKEAIYETLISEVVGQFAQALDHLSEKIQDPAEKVAGCIRYVIQRGRKDKLWGRFVVRSGFSADGMTAGMGQFFLKDLMDGIAQKRFVVNDPVAIFIAVGSMVLGALAFEVETGAHKALLLPTPGESSDLEVRIAALALQILGLTPKDAKIVVGRPLPQMMLPGNPFE